MAGKQLSIEDILDREKEMVLNAKETYGEFYVNVMEFDALLNECIKSINPDKFIFCMFFSQVHKHLLLAIFSVLRLHQTQARMNLRQVLEAASNAAYAMAHSDPDNFAKNNDDGTITTPQKLSSNRYKWLDDNYPVDSNILKEIKGQINNTSSHSNIINTHNNFEYVSSKGGYNMRYFDKDDTYIIKIGLWQIANSTAAILKLFLSVNKDHMTVVFSEDTTERLSVLIKKKQLLRDEIMQSDRYKRTTESNAD